MMLVRRRIGWEIRPSGIEAGIWYWRLVGII